ncbi:iron ABC transporter permease [Allorhizobium sp. BGMRC 0089]|uniref:lipocalin-like domain-containing protein n=1 Tax=Allorhizobium sonneratiae TaxID=2934936 RepID=UPI002033AD99|nr:lipocalin-like domain-containing protein [Allorhizobium sonneratiae]MCM2293187.1 iron ABC transporter permease [Allorhizobium sonneratiae]
MLLCLAVALPGEGLAQGFAGLGTTVQGFALPRPGVALRFPGDHGAHPDYRIEWWYVTANLKGSDGKDYGAQWTLFRSALAPGEKSGWMSPQIWMGHAALTSQSHHLVAETLARGGIGEAGVTVNPFSAWINDWSMSGKADEKGVLSGLTLKAKGKGFSYDLALDVDGPLVEQGDHGYSIKSASGQASYYYSEPFLTVKGTIQLPSGPVAVTGKAWLDHEWSSQPLATDQKGWDWFSLHFADGGKLMGFRLRGASGDFTSATWISADGKAEALGNGALRLTVLERGRVAGRDIPLRWRLDLPEKHFSVETTPLNSQSWMAVSVPYWEGPIRFSGTTSGVGYLEMTGY